MKVVGIYIALTAFLYILSLGWAQLDLRLNPWLSKVPFRWFQIFTTRHAMTIWYAKNKEDNPFTVYLALGIYSALASLFIMWAIFIR